VLVESTKIKIHWPQQSVKRAQWGNTRRPKKMRVVLVNLVSSRSCLKQSNTIVNFVSLVKLLHLYQLNAQLVLTANTKKAIHKPPLRAKLAPPVFILRVLPLYAKIAKKESFKNWPMPLNTIVNFVPKQNHLMLHPVLVKIASVENIKKRTLPLLLRANSVLRVNNGKARRPHVIPVSLASTNIKTMPIQLIANFVPLEKGLLLNPPRVWTASMDNTKIRMTNPVLFVCRATKVPQHHLAMKVVLIANQVVFKLWKNHNLTDVKLVQAVRSTSAQVSVINVLQENIKPRTQ